MESILLGRNIESMPDVAQLIEANDPRVMRKTLITLGYPLTAERDYRVAIVEEYFDLMGADEPAYHWFYSKILEDGTFSSIPHDVLAQLKLTADKKAFDKVVFRATEDGNEMLAIGLVKHVAGEEEFLVARWSKTSLTSLEDIRELKEFADDDADRSQRYQANAARARENRQRFLARFRKPAEVAWNYRESVALAASIGMFGEAIPGSAWWLLPGGVLTIGSMISIDQRKDNLRSGAPYRDEYSNYFSGWKSPIRRVTSWFALAAIGMFVATGILDLVNQELAVHTKDVLVCQIGKGLGVNSEGQDDMWIKGPQGVYDLQSGIYNGVHYYHPEVASQTLHVGQALRITYHGAHMGPGYVTGVTTLPDGTKGLCQQ